MFAIRNSRSNKRGVPSKGTGQHHSPSSVTPETITSQLQQLKITSVGDEQSHRSRFSKNTEAFSAGQPSGGDQPQLIHQNPRSTIPIFRPSKKGLRWNPYGADTLDLPPSFARGKLFQAKRILAQQNEREGPYQNISVVVDVDADLAASLSTQLQLSPVGPTTYLPVASVAEEPDGGYLDVDALQKTFDDILAESDQAPSLGGPDCSSTTTSLSPSLTSSSSTLPSVVSQETTLGIRRTSGKAETVKSIQKHHSSTPYTSVNKRPRQHRTIASPNDPQEIPLAVVLQFNRANGVQCNQEQCEELLKYRSPDPRKIYRANPGNPQRAKEILAEHRVIWGLHHSLRLHLDQWNQL